MEVLIKIAQLILSLSILVILHEFGHFAFAKIFKARVEKFYLFFNPWFSLFKVKRGDTEYGLGWLPLGGYVKISGMIDESMDKEQLKQPAQPWEFRSKPAWQRLLIMIGGVLVNFLLAVFIYIMMLYINGEKYLPTKNLSYGIVCDSTALNLGLQNGDKILTLDHKEIEDFSKILPHILLDDVQSIQVDRNGEKLNIPLNSDLVTQLIKQESFFISPRIPFQPFIINGFAAESPGKEAGLQKGDTLYSINGHVFEYYDEFQHYLKDYYGKEITIGVKNNAYKEIPVTLTTDGMIGISREMVDFFEFAEIKYSFFASIPAGIKKGYLTSANYLKQFKLVFNPKTEAYKSVGSFITIGNLFPGYWDWEFFWSMTALLSIMLGVFNLLPIPAMDGGHVMFLIYEIVAGRKPGDKFLEYAQIAGMVILLSLMVLAIGNDIVKHFF